MRFTKPFWAGIADGTITLAFRPWKRPTVVVGRAYRTGGGRVEVTAIDVVEAADITDHEARSAGHESASELKARFTDIDADRSLYRVAFRLLDEIDPRQELAETDDLSPEDVDEIDTRLGRLDRASKTGPWTMRTLELIEANPGVRAPDLAERQGRETQPFKLDVRKLKNLGLTISLKIGYRLSPRGTAYLAATRERGARAR